MQNGLFKNYVLYYWIMFIDAYKLQLFMVGFILSFFFFSFFFFTYKYCQVASLVISKFPSNNLFIVYYQSESGE